MQAKDFNAGDKIKVAAPLPENTDYDGREGIVQAIGPHPVSFAPAVTVLFGDGPFAKVATLYPYEIERSAGNPVDLPQAGLEKRFTTEAKKAALLGLTVAQYRSQSAQKRLETMARKGVKAGTKKGQKHGQPKPLKVKKEFVRRPVVAEEPVATPISNVPRTTGLPSLAELNAKLTRYQR